MSEFTTHSEKETFQLARRLGKGLRAGDAVALVGEIGSGKTLFIKGLCQGLGVRDSEEVKSPTFVLLHIYQAKVPVYHFDLYRLERGEELDAIGFDDFVSNRAAVSLIEWADHAEKRIPPEAVWVELKITGPSSRDLVIASPAVRGEAISAQRLPACRPGRLRRPPKNAADSSQ